MRARGLSLVVALMASILTASSSAAYPSSAYPSSMRHGQPLERLFFQRGTSLDWIAPAHPRRVHFVHRVALEISASTVAGDYVYFATDGDGARAAIWRVRTNGGQLQRLVPNLEFPEGVAVIGNRLFWLDGKGIGRSYLDGSHSQRRFVVPPTERGGGVGEGLATDGEHLFFSRCMRDTVARVNADGRDMRLNFIRAAHDACPQGLAADHHYVYWTELGFDSIGRAAVDGSHVNSVWLFDSTPDDSGPFDLAVGGGHIYWDWCGGPECRPSWIAAASQQNGYHRNRKFIKGDEGLAVG